MVFCKKALIIALLMGLIVCLGVTALDCQYDPRPYISVSGKTIDWLCEVINRSSSCYGLIMYSTEGGVNDTIELISISPDSKIIEGVGEIDSFKSEGHFVNIQFKTDYLVENMNYSFKVICVSPDRFENFSADISPSYSELRSTPYIYTYIVENSAVIVILLILIIALIMVIVTRRK